MKKVVHRLVPKVAKRKLELIRERSRLSKIKPRTRVETESLLSKEKVVPEDIFFNARTDDLWADFQKRFAETRIARAAGGVNPGDRRALFYLVSHFKPSSILEVGTHIGASTVYLACALKMVDSNQHADSKLVTVDILDVNSPKGPWRQAGAGSSPKELLESQEVDGLVDFVEAPSLGYLEKTREKFDLVFLDGDHSAATVYREVHAALSCLRPGGLILLHDYFPECKPIWSNGVVKPGPYLAFQRLIREGASLEIMPLGGLPWPTKVGSNSTSLALLLS